MIKKEWYNLKIGDIIKTGKIIKDCCKNKGILFLDINKVMANIKYESLLSDGLHPNSAGYDYLFELIKKFLQEQRMI